MASSLLNVVNHKPFMYVEKEVERNEGKCRTINQTNEPSTEMSKSDIQTNNHLLNQNCESVFHTGNLDFQLSNQLLSKTYEPLVKTCNPHTHSTELCYQIYEPLFQTSEYDIQTDIKLIITNKQICVEGGCSSTLPISELDKYFRHVRLKDIGYSWIIVFAMLMSNVLVAGYVKSFGIMYNAVLVEFPDTSSATAGLMMGLLGGCRSIFAPVAGALTIKLGSRKVIFLGTLFCCTGFLSSYFCTSVFQLSFTLGAMIGIGICLIETCQVVVVASYFEEKLSLANSVRISGNTIGGMVFPFLLTYLIEFYGVRTSRILLSAVFLHSFICMALIRSTEVHKKINILNAMKYVHKNNQMKISKTEKKIIYSTLLKTFQDSPKTSKRKVLEFSYWKNGVYYVFILVSMSASLALPFVIYFIPIFGKSFGLSLEQNSALISFQAFLDLIFRIIIGFLSDRKLYKKAHGFIFCLVLGSTGIVAIPLCAEVWQLFLATTLFTAGSAGYYSFMNVVLTEQFGRSSIATTWGFVRMVQGFCNFAYSPLLGVIIDVTGSFVPVFIVMGGGMMLASLILLLEPLVIKITKSNVIIT